VLISADIDQAIEPGESVLLQEHLRDCPICRSTADSWRVQHAQLRRAFAPRRQAAQSNAERALAQIRVTAVSPRRRPRWLPMLLSAAAGFLLAILLFRPWHEKVVTVPIAATQLDMDAGSKSAPKDQPTLTLAVANRNVFVCPSDTDVWQAAGTGEKIPFGTQVRTGPAVLCEFRASDGSQIRLNGGTELVFNSSRHVTLTKGQILALVAKAPNPFQVVVPKAIVTALGTEFDLQCKPAETVLTVLEGSTKVEGSGPDAVVASGEAAIIVDGRIKETQPVQNLIRATEWTHELLMLKGRDNQELAKRVDEILARIGETKLREFDEQDIRRLGDHCVLPLTRYIQSEGSRASENKERRAMAARIVSDLSNPWAIPYLIELLADKDGLVRYQAARALKRLTQQTFNRDPNEWREKSWDSLRGTYQKWQAWWQENKHRYPDTP